MNKTNKTNWIWMVLCTAALLVFASCGSGSPIDLDGETATNASSTEGDTDLIGEAWSSAVLDEPVLPKDASDFNIEPALDKELLQQLFIAQHVPLSEGTNSVEVTDYIAHSPDVANTEVEGPPVWHFENGHLVYGPKMLPAVQLASSAGDVSFVTYGFKEIPENKEIIGVRITGLSDAELFNPGQGLYIGMGDYGKDSYRWYGPLGTESVYELNFINLDSTNANQRGYLTIAVYGGDTYSIVSLDVIVGDKKPGIQIGEIDLQTIFN